MKILVGMSGGVDSSTVACILKDKGYDVIGATMSIWDKELNYKINTQKEGCFSPHEEEDIKAAQEVCQKLDIPYHVIDCSKQYQRRRCGFRYFNQSNHSDFKKRYGSASAAFERRNRASFIGSHYEAAYIRKTAKANAPSI